MNDQELWSAALRQITEAWTCCAPPVVERLTELLRQVAAHKEELHSLVAASGADRLCHPCGGQCCFGGKHHVTVIDLLAYLALGAEIFTPWFDAPVCPYLGGNGCLMPPAFRPRTCIVFLCEPVLERIADDGRSSIDRLETGLARLYGDIGELLAISPASSLLLVAERTAARRGSLIDTAAIHKE
ncbi:hypothetical protein [Geobacter argillaceus]|nr:hypothetical protein [Geobacter argillaceus]